MLWLFGHLWNQCKWKKIEVKQLAEYTGFHSSFLFRFWNWLYRDRKHLHSQTMGRTVESKQRFSIRHYKIRFAHHTTVWKRRYKWVLIFFKCKHLNDLFPFPWMDDLFQPEFDEKQCKAAKKAHTQNGRATHKQMKMFLSL